MSSKSTTAFASSKQEQDPLDAPPAYSPKRPNDESEEYHQTSNVSYTPASSQPTTVYRQENYAQSSYSQPSTLRSTYQQPSVVSQSQPMTNSYQYNTRRGPIGNIINLASSSVVGSSSHPSQQSTNSPSKIALGFVNSFLSGHLQRRERKSYEREMKHERKFMKKCGRIGMSAQPRYAQPQYAQQQQQPYISQQPYLQQQSYIRQPYMQQRYGQQQPIIIQQRQRSNIVGDVLLAEAIL